MTNSYQYEGDELRLFAQANNWKRYFGYHIRPYLQGHVLEVGAGFGSTTRILKENHQGPWTCLEPDPQLAATLQKNFREVEVLIGTLEILRPDQKYATILYIDVLEHIKEDAQELVQACTHLQPQGCLIIISPAHTFLFSPFDAAIGHFRRYTKTSVLEIIPKNLIYEELIYLDSAGLFASLANRLFLKQSLPTEKQIQTWDKWFIPLSRFIDPLFGYRQGKSILGIWRQPG